MSDLRQAAQQALEAMEDHAKQYPHMQKGYTVDAITALRAALAEQDAEPVAWMTRSKDPLPLFHKTKAGAEAWGAEPQPLYTHPPRREWIGLDLKEMDEIIDGNMKITDGRLADAVYGIVLDTMHVLMEKNHD